MYWFGDDLYELYLPLKQETSETIAEIEFLTEVIGGLKYKDYVLGKTFDEEKRNLIKKIIKERVTSGRPIQQIIGKSYFCGEIFLVNEKTLIPRPETELIIECLKKYFSAEDNFKMLEIGIGTGCISIMAAKIFKNAHITGTDICQQCIDISQKNARLHNEEENTDFILSDLFENVLEKYDVIVSNPPYISLADVNSVQENVLRYEPHSALFAPDNGYYFYKKIISESFNYIKQNSVLIFELGINQAKKVSDFFEKNKFADIRIIKDFNNIDRVISATYHS